MPRRKRVIGSKLSKNHLFLSSADFSLILTHFEAEIDEEGRANMQEELAIALAFFRSDHRVRQLQLRDNELNQDLKQIERTAAKLGELLRRKREAEDAMVRVTHPDLDQPALVASPTMPPVFQAKAVEIEVAAKEARAKSPKHLPYISRNRSDVALDLLLERLLRIWETFAREAPTFMGDDNVGTSPFVRFALECCRLVGLRMSASALSKRATSKRSERSR